MEPKKLSKQLAMTQYVYRDKPIQFAKHICNVDLSGQQKGLIHQAIKRNAMVAVKSATGTGKTTTLAVLILHQLFCEPDCKIIATAPSAGQLARGLRSEISKIYNRIKNPTVKDYFDMNQELVFAKGRKDTQFCSFVTGSAENKESLAGVHADKVLIIIDEASALNQEIYDTLIGNLTTSGSVIMTSNPVRSVGSFYDIFNSDDLKKIWKTYTFTALESPFVSDEWVELIRAQYGEDSDFYRMRVLGEFARATDTQFMNALVVDEAIKRNLAPVYYNNFPKVMGVDVARFGDDKTIFVLRQGPRILDIIEFSHLDTMEVAAKVKEYRMKWAPSAIFIDGIGIGAGVVDRLKADRVPVNEVVVSGKSTDPAQYSNLRAQLWGEMRRWLENGADVPNSSDLRTQFLSMTYGYNGKMQIQLASKKDIKKQGFVSPDKPDAIALTFAKDVFHRTLVRSGARPISKSNYLWV